MPGMDRVLWSVTKGIFLLVVAFLLAAAKSIVKLAVSLTGGILRALAGKSRKRCRKRSERRTGIEVMTQQPHAAVFRISGPIRQCKSLADAKKQPSGCFDEVATSYFCLAAIVGVDVLDFCVRDGNRYFHIAVITTTTFILLILGSESTVFSHLPSVFQLFFCRQALSCLLCTIRHLSAHTISGLQVRLRICLVHDPEPVQIFWRQF